jgi:hypothetical protein
MLVGAAARDGILAAQGAGDVTRHAVFVVLEVGLGALLVLRPRLAFYAALLLGAQQMYSHGLALSDSFVGASPLDKWSLAVCLFYPTLVTFLFIERQEEKEKSEQEEADRQARRPLVD